MSIFKIVESILHKINEETTSANIAYLPGGFEPIRAAIVGLGRKKKKWKIKVLKDMMNEGYMVSFEDALKIRVANENWDAFQKDVSPFIRLRDNAEVSLLESILHEKEVVIPKLLANLKNEIYTMLVEPPVSNNDDNLAVWVNNLGKERYVTPKSTLIRYETVETNIQQLVNNLTLKYKNDRGMLEEIISTIKQKRPLNVFDPFDSYDNIYGGVVESEINGFKLVFRSFISMSWVPSESITLPSLEAAEKVDAIAGTKVVGVTLYPVGKVFAPRVFSEIEKELSEKEEK